MTGNQGLIWWKTWFREQNGAVDAVAFFQKMKHKGEAYAMCVGFAQNLLPDPTDLALEYQYSEFLEKISDKGNATGLHEFVKSDLKADFVYIVDLPPESASLSERTQRQWRWT